MAKTSRGDQLRHLTGNLKPSTGRRAYRKFSINSTWPSTPEDEKQPKPEETGGLSPTSPKFLIKQENARENRGKVVLRRLNRVEYLNTIRDLFDLKMVDFDPTVTFPPDDSTEGFDNVGEVCRSGIFFRITWMPPEKSRQGDPAVPKMIITRRE